MKNWLTLMILACMLANTLFAQSNIQQPTSINSDGIAPAASAILDVQSTEQGMLVPRMTSAQRIAIAAPATGLILFDTDANSFWFFNGTEWTEIAMTYLPGTGISITGGIIENTGDTDPFDDLTSGSMAGGDLSGTFPNPDIAAGAVGSDEIADGSVTNLKISSGAATNGKVLTADGVSGVTWSSAPKINVLQDADSDTKIQVEESSDEDVIRFDLGGTEHMVLRKNLNGFARLELPNTLNNTFVGNNSGFANTEGQDNTASGTGTLFSNTSGSNNTAVGLNALYQNTSGNENTADGVNSLGVNMTGNYNTAIGSNVLTSNATGDSNTGVGQGSLSSNTIGNNNTAIGKAANVLSNNLTNATAIGYNAEVGCSDCLVLGGTGSNAVNVGIGDNTPSAGKLVVDAGTGGIGLVNNGKVLIGTDTPINPYQGYLLQIKSTQYESGIILNGANGGSNYNSFIMQDNAGSGWSLVHKSQVFNDHFLEFDYFDSSTQTWNFQVLKLTADGRTGLGYDWNQDPSSSKLSVKGGDINIVDIGSGVIMKSPDGQCWRVTVSNTGTFVSSPLSCP